MASLLRSVRPSLRRVGGFRPSLRPRCLLSSDSKFLNSQHQRSRLRDSGSSSPSSHGIRIQRRPFSSSAGVAATDDSILLRGIRIDDPLCVQKLKDFGSDHQGRDEFLRTALKIGVSTMHHLRSELDVQQLRVESTKLLQSLEAQMEASAGRMTQQMSVQLQEYFNPKSGRFNERIERLLAEDGDIQRVLNRNLQRHETELANRLAEAVGAHSPLMKLLNPNESAGLLSAIRNLLETQLGQQRQQILMQFSLDHPDSALRRLVQQLNINQSQLQSDVQTQIQGLVKEFSLDNRDSALSRLVENVQSAQRTIRSEFSFDNSESAFSRLHAMLDSTHELIDHRLTLDATSSPLSLLKRELVGLLEQHAEKTRHFQEEVKLSLAEMQQGHRRESAPQSKGATGDAAENGAPGIGEKGKPSRWQEGIEFEQALRDYLSRLCAGAGDIFTPTGATTGEIRHCKVGDGVWELGPDSAAPGVRIVIEAKRDKTYTLGKALQEIETARKNRAAHFGLFVFGPETAPEELEGLARYGVDVVVAWDPSDVENPNGGGGGGSEVYLRAAVMALRAMALSHGGSAGIPGHPAAAEESLLSGEQLRKLHSELDRSLLEIEKRINSLDDVTRSAQTIQNASTKILDRIRINRTALLSQVRNLEEIAEQFSRMHRRQLQQREDQQQQQQQQRRSEEEEE